MTAPDESSRLTGVGALLMTLVLAWSGALAVGFGYAAATGTLSASRSLVFWLVAAFLGLIAVRTGYELVRRIVFTLRS